MTKKAAKGGGRLSRSETVTVRLDPKLNYLCELASRAQRRTKSSFIEWAIEHALGGVSVPGSSRSFDEPDSTISGIASELWDTDEPDRLVKLAFNAPSLMNHEEQVLWKLISENGYLWKGHYPASGDQKWKWQVEPDSLIMDRLRAHWDVFVSVANNEASKDTLPGWNKTKYVPKTTSSLDDDIPF